MEAVNLSADLKQLWDGLSAAQEDNYKSVCERCRLTRQLGMYYKGIMKKSDVPERWDEHLREHLAWRANLYSTVPEDQFEYWLNLGKDKFKFNEGNIRSKALSWRKQKQREETARKPLLHQGVSIYTSDIKNICSLRSGAEAAAIITDPPYPHNFIDCWSELAKFAGRTLQKRGWLIAMSGQRYIPEVLERLITEGKEAGLRYCWTIAVHVPGQCTTSWLGGGDTDTKDPNILQVGINVQWKPVFCFIKGNERPSSWPLGTDFITSPANDKEYHEWGQNELVFDRLVEGFTQRGELIVDPFLGGGTTAISAVRSGRAFEGFDIDPSSEIITLDRLSKLSCAESAQNECFSPMTA